MSCFRVRETATARIICDLLSSNHHDPHTIILFHSRSRYYRVTWLLVPCVLINATKSGEILPIMPTRPSKSTEQALPDQTLIIDNGAFTIKAGFAKSSPELEDCHVVQNCIARDREKRVWVGSHLDKCQDFGELAYRRPVEKGYIVNWEAEKAIWESLFLDKAAKLKVSPILATWKRLSNKSFSVIHMRPIWFLQKHQMLLRHYKPTATKWSLKSSSLHLIIDV